MFSSSNNNDAVVVVVLSGKFILFVVVVFISFGEYISIGDSGIVWSGCSEWGCIGDSCKSGVCDGGVFVNDEFTFIFSFRSIVSSVWLCVYVNYTYHQLKCTPQRARCIKKVVQ